MQGCTPNVVIADLLRLKRPSYSHHLKCRVVKMRTVKWDVFRLLRHRREGGAQIVGQDPRV